MKIKVKSLRNLHYPMLVVSIVLAACGLINLYSATVSFDDVTASSLFKAQLAYTGLGIVVMLIVAQLSLRRLYMLAPLAYAFSLLLLVLVLVVGSTVHGSQSWLDLGLVRLQPSEFAKLGLVFFLSWQLTGQAFSQALGPKELLKPSLIFLVPSVLVILQKDLGSSLFFGFLFATLLFIQGVHWRIVVLAMTLVAVGSLVSYQFLLKPYQKDRIASFMEPERDAKGSGYHLVQSKIAVGSGQFLGRGYLKGASNKLKFLPERHTDFIFPVLAEEWGFVGSVSVLGLYALLLLCGVNIASRSNNRFGFFLSVGFTSLFFWHLVINLGGVLGLMPLTGVPLPFLSYGGSSLLTNWVALGFLQAIYKSRTQYGF